MEIDINQVSHDLTMQILKEHPNYDKTNIVQVYCDTRADIVAALMVEEKKGRAELTKKYVHG